MARTPYTPAWTQTGDLQPDLGDGTLAGSWTPDGEISIGLVLGESTVLGEGAFVFGLPTVAEGINAEVTAVIGGERRTGWAVLRDDQRSDHIAVADMPGLPVNVPDGTFWGSGNQPWAPGDSLTITGRMLIAPPVCPDCGVIPDQPHELDCEIALCPLCGFVSAICPHAGTLSMLTLWKGVLPGQAEADELGYASREALFEAAAAGELMWNSRRARWELPVPPDPDLVVGSYGFAVGAERPPEWPEGEGARFVVRLPQQAPDGRIVWAADLASAVTQMQQFVAEAQAALAQLRQQA